MRKRKIKIYELPVYYKYGRIHNKRNGMSGYIYYLVDPLNDEQKKAFMATYSNVAFCESVAEYAPEYVHQCIIAYDKAITA